MTAYETGTPEDRRTVAITLGHDGLTVSRSVARRNIESVLLLHRANVLSIFHDGEGEWEGSHETCDAWLATLPAVNIPHVRTCLARLARDFGQDSIGLIVHGGTHPAYVPAAER